MVVQRETQRRRGAGAQGRRDAETQKQGTSNSKNIVTGSGTYPQSPKETQSTITSQSSDHLAGPTRPLTRPLIRRVAPLVHARSIDVDIARVKEAGGPVVKPDFDGTEDDDDVA
jgi:hypothetical protein